jgi:hypothetical protein
MLGNVVNLCVARPAELLLAPPQKRPLSSDIRTCAWQARTLHCRSRKRRVTTQKTAWIAGGGARAAVVAGLTTAAAAEEEVLRRMEARAEVSIMGKRTRDHLAGVHEEGETERDPINMHTQKETRSTCNLYIKGTHSNIRVESYPSKLILPNRFSPFPSLTRSLHSPPPLYDKSRGHHSMQKPRNTRSPPPPLPPPPFLRRASGKEDFQ